MASRNTLRLGFAALVLALAVPVSSQSRDDRPASVSSEQWIRLGEGAGVAITNRPAKLGGEAKGELWVKLGGSWSPATLEQARQLVPAR